MSLDRPGFADPVADAQRTFRAVLDAMAHPGRLHLVGAQVQPPPGLAPATAALLLTLADADTTLWLSTQCEPTRDWIAFHCGAAFTRDPAQSAFAVVTGAADFSAFSAGSDDAPEQSATLIAQVAGFGTGREFRLTGPGLRTEETVIINGLPNDFAAQWAANHAQYPRGIDLILCAGAQLVALPRSVSVAPA